MSRQTQMNIPITDSLEEETMHLFDAEARKEEALCGAETSADDRTSLQYYAERRRAQPYALGPSASRARIGRSRSPGVFAGNWRPKDGRTRPKSTDGWPTHWRGRLACL